MSIRFRFRWFARRRKSLSRRLEDRADRDQVYVIPLGLSSQKPVVVEICASLNSAIWKACRDRGLECISVTKEERNLLTRETQKELYRLLQRDVPLWIHISTPCTAGCRYRFLNRRRSRGNQYARQWKKVYAIHGEMWEFLGKFLTKAMKRTRVIVSQEWPVSGLGAVWIGAALLGLGSGKRTAFRPPGDLKRSCAVTNDPGTGRWTSMSRASTRSGWESICSRRHWSSFFEKRPRWSRQTKKGKNSCTLLALVSVS